ncbi:unnamed protein product [Fusarium graminearum]|uniref:Chromosome 2, complete genome n=1 Tax=Gibberella zeae (strain ATCC MYA-4620 / CBS 123657 / FGSC 9075 / NRRL 31084 / PH-1) TaxID=229533 RepID=A0A098DF61_GIBZE|nr:unnamed protein product [Fusarium graminearum]
MIGSPSPRYSSVNLPGSAALKRCNSGPLPKSVDQAVPEAQRITAELLNCCKEIKRFRLKL